MAAFTHRQATGQAITTPALAEHFGIPHQLADKLINALGEVGEPAHTNRSPITTVNGTPTGGRV
jgi:hypothetical protein